MLLEIMLKRPSLSTSLKKESKVNILKIIFATALIMGMASSASADFKVNISGDGFEDLVNKSAYDYYANSGTLIGTYAGNSENLFTFVQDKVRDYLSDPGFTLVETPSVEYHNYSDDAKSGTWNTIPPLGPSGTIGFYIVKAGHAFSLYWVNPAAATGSWSTYDIWNSPLRGTGGNGGIEISHFNGYNPVPSVPEPTTLLLLGSGLVCLAAFRKKFKS